MQQIKCVRSLLTCWPPAVQSFSSATSIMYRNNKDWDFKGNPTSPVMYPLQGKPLVQGYDQRKREFGMRTRACASKSGGNALTRLKGMIKSDRVLYDGSTKDEVCINVLEGKNLCLLFSKLNIPDRVIDSLKLVHQELQKRQRDVIVWIPVGYKRLSECDQTFNDLRRKMPWYTIKCLLSSKDVKSEWNDFSGAPMLKMIGKYGNDEDPNVFLPLINEKGVKHFLS